MKICKLDATGCDEASDQLTDLLLDALAHGASLGFPAGLGLEEARRYWQEVRLALAGGACLLLVAAHAGTLVGAVQLALCRRPTDRHCAELRMMMVHSRVRRRGIGSVLLRAAEAEARALGRGLLHLDLEAGSAAEQLYHGLGYSRVGELPDQARGPGADLRPRAVYTKSLLMPELA